MSYYFSAQDWDNARAQDQQTISSAVVAHQQLVTVSTISNTEANKMKQNYETNTGLDKPIDQTNSVLFMEKYPYIIGGALVVGIGLMYGYRKQKVIGNRLRYF